MEAQHSKWKNLGPGLLYAGTAIGVSHIVQSTRAGANYGYTFILFVILAHILKYPFFEMGPRYTLTTGKTLIEGIAKLGKWALPLVFILTLSTMFFIQAAVTVVTAGLAQKLFGISLAPWQWSGIILTLCFLILTLGKFNLLDHLIKVIIIALSATTLIAAVSSFLAPVERIDNPGFEFDFSGKGFLFLIAFIGWMPAPLDIGMWQSLWTREKIKISGGKPNLKGGLFDFKLGFWGTAFLALCFIALGANMLFGTHIELSSKGGVYAGQLLDIYAGSLGNWAYWVIGIAAFTTMFSTTLTCYDASPRLISELYRVHFNKEFSPPKIRIIGLVVLGIGTLLLLGFYISGMQQMVDLATTISFLMTPILACIYWFTLHSEGIKIGKAKTLLATLGLVFLISFGINYLLLLW